MKFDTKILTLDSAGVPRKWEDIERVIDYYVTGKIAWELGTATYTVHGGTQASGQQSSIVVNSIVAVKGPVRRGIERSPPISRRLLFARDRYHCAYCGTQGEDRHLEIEHIVPRAQGGKNTWTNLITACLHCNDIKGNRTPEQADMPLRFPAYVPNSHETLLLSNHNMLPDQRDLLLTKARSHHHTHQKGTNGY